MMSDSESGGVVNELLQVKQYLNDEQVTPLLIEALVQLTKERPDDPIKFIGECMLRDAPAGTDFKTDMTMEMANEAGSMKPPTKKSDTQTAPVIERQKSGNDSVKSADLDKADVKEDAKAAASASDEDFGKVILKFKDDRTGNDMGQYECYGDDTLENFTSQLAKKYGKDVEASAYYIGNEFIQGGKKMEEYRKQIKQHGAVVVVRGQD